MEQIYLLPLAGIQQGLNQGTWLLIMFGCVACIGVAIWGGIEFVRHRDMTHLTVCIVAVIFSAIAFTLVKNSFAAMTGAPINLTPTAID